MKHEYNKGQQVKTSQGLRPAFIVASQATEAGHPGETALHDPSAGQQHEATFGLRQRDDFQAHPMGLGRLGRHIAGGARIDVGQFHPAPGDFLDRFGQLAHLRPVLVISWGHMQGQQIAQRIHCGMDLAAFAAFGSIITRSMPNFRESMAACDCQKWRQTALSYDLRPDAAPHAGR